MFSLQTRRVQVWIAGWAALGMGLGCAACAARAADALVFEVAAGQCDREDVLVSAELPPAHARPAAISLVRLDTGEAVPAQWGPGTPPRVWWMVTGRLPAGATRRYQLSATSAKSREDVTVVDDGKQITVKIGPRPVLTYQEAVVAPPNPKEPYYAKSGYIHPVLSPSGKRVTDDFNPDHAHQHGIMFAWRKTTCEGRTTNGWDQKSALGRVEHVRVEQVASGPVFGQFRVRLQQVDLTAPGGPRPILEEGWCVRVENRADRHVVDLESCQTCAGHSPVSVDEMHYGGMMIRGAVQWSRGRDFDYLTEQGKTKKDGNHTRPRWVDFCGPIDGRPTGILALDHPANFRFPQPVRLHPTMPYFCFSPAVLGAFTIEPGASYVSRYRFVIYDGKTSPAEAARQWADYAHPPQVRLVARGGNGS
jgi:hypothetical protein